MKLTYDNYEYNVVLSNLSDIDVAISRAIALAKQREANEVSADDLLLGCLWGRSQFGVVRLGPWLFDLEAYGVDWLFASHEKSTSKVSYSDAVVGILDRAARVARAEGTATVRVEDILAAFANEKSGLMSKLRDEFQITNSAWRGAVGDLLTQSGESPLLGSETSITRDFLTPEEAAAALGIHVQTLRAYVRSGKLPALRLAGERAIRIRRVDLEKVLEPVIVEKQN